MPGFTWSILMGVNNIIGTDFFRQLIVDKPTTSKVERFLRFVKTKH